MEVGSITKIAKTAFWYALNSLTSPRATFFLGEPFFWLRGMRRKCRRIELSETKRVLVVRLDEMGDLVLTVPFLRELRRNLPDATITLIVKPAVYNLVELCSYVDQVLTYEWSVAGKYPAVERHWRALQIAYHHLWCRRFDLAIVPRWDADSYHASFVAYLSGAPLRVGYSENVTAHKQLVNEGCDRLFTHILNDNTLKHEVRRNLDVIQFLGGTVQEDRLELWRSSEDATFGDELLKSHGISRNTLLIAFGPGKRDPKRRWPLSSFVELGAWLKREYHARIMIVGEMGEKALADELQSQLGHIVINMVGQTTLRQAFALLRHCDLYVGNDYGPKHIAAAAGVPVIEINGHPLAGSPFHTYSPMRFGPWGVTHLVLQPETALEPCSDACTAAQPHCILGITVEQVKNAVMTLLREDSRKISERS